jgi:uncharacterized protein YecA (UPF0149 family)
MEETKEYVSKNVEQKILEVPTVQVMPETGTIMDAVQMSEENNKQREAMEAAISNDQMKRFEAMAKAWQEAHTQKVRKFDKVGRNDPCPCGSVDENGKPKKYKNCCLSSGKYEGLKNIK